MSDDRENVPAYALVKDCGCCEGICVDDPKNPDRAKKILLEWIDDGSLDDGFHIERTTVGQARQMFGKCKLHQDEDQAEVKK